MKGFQEKKSSLTEIPPPFPRRLLPIWLPPEGGSKGLAVSHLSLCVPRQCCYCSHVGLWERRGRLWVGESGHKAPEWVCTPTALLHVGLPQSDPLPKTVLAWGRQDLLPSTSGVSVGWHGSC